MQSHASRHVCSEFLKDRHPDLSPPFPKDVIKDEIAEAYGRRGITKLIDVLALPKEDLQDEQRSLALRVFIGLLTTQEHKADAVNGGAAIPLTRLISNFDDPQVLRLSCVALESLAQIQQGRLVIVESGGVVALNDALKTTPEASAGALRAFVSSNDGVTLLTQFLEPVVPSLVQMINQPKSSGVSIKACENAAATLAGLSSTDPGIMSCLTHHVPKCIVQLMNRGISDDLRFEKSLNECFEQCCSCLEQICHHPYGKTAVREADGVRALGTILDIAQWHRETITKATAALMAVSIEKESKTSVVQYAAKQLVRLIKEDNAETASNARAALISACEHLEARSLLGPFLPENEQVEILFRGPLPAAPPDFRYKVTLPYNPDARDDEV